MSENKKYNIPEQVKTITTTPINPDTGFIRTYVKDNGNFYTLNSNGEEIEVTGEITLLIDTINWSDIDFQANATTVFTRTFTGLKPAGYKIIDGYFEVTEQFTNNGTNSCIFSIGLSLQIGNENVIGKTQLINYANTGMAGSGINAQQVGGNIFATLNTGSSISLSTRSISIDNSSDIILNLRSDVAMSTGNFTTGNVNYFITLKKIN